MAKTKRESITRERPLSQTQHEYTQGHIRIETDNQQKTTTKGGQYGGINSLSDLDYFDYINR